MSSFITTYFKPNKDTLRFMIKRLSEHRNSHIFEGENKKQVDAIHKRWKLDECLDNNEKLQKLVGRTRLYFSYFYIGTMTKIQAEIRKHKHNKTHQEIVHHYYDRDLQMLKDVGRFKLFHNSATENKLDNKIIIPQFKRSIVKQNFQDRISLSNFKCFCYAINTNIDYALPIKVCLNGYFYHDKNDYQSMNAFTDFTLDVQTIIGPEERKDLFAKTIENNEPVRIFSTAMASLFRSISSSVGNILYDQEVRNEFNNIFSNLTNEERSALIFFNTFNNLVGSSECGDKDKLESIFRMFDAIYNFYSNSSDNTIGNGGYYCPSWFVEIYKQFDSEFKDYFELHRNSKALDDSQIDLLFKSLRDILIKEG